MLGTPVITLLTMAITAQPYSSNHNSPSSSRLQDTPGSNRAERQVPHVFILTSIDHARHNT